jgi:large repetitive protein
MFTNPRVAANRSKAGRMLIKKSIKATALSSVRRIVVAFACFASNWVAAQSGAPLAGIPIVNQASATYVDSATGRSERLDSNRVSTPVAKQILFSLTQSQNLVAAQGANVRFQHAITNQGNFSESYGLLLQDIYAGTFAFTAVQLFADANNDGVPDSATPISVTPILQPGETFQFLAIAQTPATAGVGQEDRFTIIAAAASGGAGQQTNVDTVTITNNAVVVVNKGLSINVGPSPNYDITVTLSYSNIGNSIATNVSITDVIGAPNAVPAYDTTGMQYVPASGSWQTLPVTDAPAGDVNGINYSATTVGVGATSVTTVNAVIASVAPGASGTIKFKVDVKAGLAPGIGKTTNAVAVAYSDGISQQTSASNNTTYYRVLADGPDLVLTKRNGGGFTVGALGRYIFKVANQGTGPTTTDVLVTDVMPFGMQVEQSLLPAGGADGWVCTIAAAANPAAQIGEKVVCQSSALILAGQDHVNPLVIAVRPQANLVSTATVNKADVSGGGESPIAINNNQASDTVEIAPNSSIAGYAWYDNNHDGIRSANEPPGVNIIVELLDASGALVAKTRTIADGSYLLPNLAPGANFQLVFRYPDGSTPVASSPINGEIGRPNPSSNGVVSKGTIKGLTLKPGSNVVQQNLRLDPSGVVYDAVTRQPVAGAVVRFEGPAGFNPVEHLVGGAGNVEQTTGPSGFYQYILLEGAPIGLYKLVVTSPSGYTLGTSQLLQPASSVNCSVKGCLDPTGLAPRGAIYSVHPANLNGAPPVGQDTTYFLSFYLDVGTDPELVNNHIPIDPILLGRPGLLVEKVANKGTAEIGDSVQYTVRIRNSSKSTFPQVQLIDQFPFGFKYVPGSVRLDGIAIAEPTKEGVNGLKFTGIGDLAADASKALTYLAILAPGSQQSDGINRAYARSAISVSNTAVARVTVSGGVFSNRGIVLGKIYVDCNKNHVQDPEELGIPGVRFYLQNGSYAVTDSEGKFSFAGLPPRTHVIKVDRTTLPKDARMAAISNRNAMDGQSRFIDLKNGELHRADFAEFGCSASVIAEVKSRRTKGEVFSIEVDRALLTKLDPEGKNIAPSDVRALPASGLLSGQNLPLSTSLSTLSRGPETPVSAAPIASQLPSATPENFQDKLAQMDNSLNMLDFKDGDTLPIAQTNVRVKGAMGATMKLLVNGKEVPDARIGVKSELAEKQIQYREYIGVPLIAGSNALELVQTDNFGNVRGSQKLSLIAPDQPGRIEIVLPKSGVAIADGVTPAKLTVLITDNKGVPVTARTPVTLEASIGRWKVIDANPNEPGVQTFVVGGSAEFELLPPLEPVDALVRVSSGTLKAEKRLPMLPELRPLIGAGVIEGILSLRNLKPGAIQPARARDGFEQELKQFSRESANGKTFAAARTAFFIKGKVQGEYLLTMAYDSDKEVRERLFRDIRPDEFYPVYGDSAIKGFDAQSTSRLYVRVDKFKSYLLLGDYSTTNLNPAQRLAQYQRAQTGLRHHYEKDGVTVDSFASRDTVRQVIRELPANGTSGPFELGLTNTLVNSERVEILTRDRNQPSIVIKTLVLTRFLDYAFEPLTGRILLRGPLPSVDPFLNPNSLRISIEIDQGGQAFWVAGTSASVRINPALTLGANFVTNMNPIAESFKRMAGTNLMYQFGERSILTAELAQTVKADGTKGTAERVEYNHDGADFKARAALAKSSTGFDNPASILRPGREEVSGRVSYRISPSTIVAAEVLHTKDTATGAQRDGVLLNVEQALGPVSKVEIGVRHVSEKVPTQVTNISAGSTLAPSATTTSAQPPTQTDLTSVRVKATTQIPGVPTASAYAEAEQDLNDSHKRLLAVGGEYQFAGRGKVYARHEFQSSLQGAFALNNLQRTNATVLGVSSEYMTNGTLFSEYRGRDSFGVRTTEAAVGLRNIFTVSEGLRLNTNVERIKSLGGSKEQESEAFGVGLDYTKSELWKGSTRVEFRDATASRSYLHTADAAVKLARDWTILGRHTWSLLETKAGNTVAPSERILQRLRGGMAYRDTDTNRFDALAMIEKKRESDSAVAAVNGMRNVWVGSAHANYHPARSVVLNGQIASKWAHETIGGVNLNSRTSLVGARATWDVTERVDVSAIASTLMNHQTKVSQKGLGIEVGYLVHSNVWLSAGYNFFGYRDQDLAPGQYSDKGAFLRLRIKFDEESLKRRPPTENR